MSSTLPILLSNGKTLNIGVKKSSRAKQLWLKANVHGLYIIVPTTIRYEINDILNFIDGKKNDRIIFPANIVPVRNLLIKNIFNLRGLQMVNRVTFIYGN